MLANALKMTAAAAMLGLGAIATTGTPASADTFRTRCYGDDCVRMQCDDWGRDCFRIGEFDRYDYDRVTPYNYTRTYNVYPDTYYGPDYDHDYYNDYGPDYDYDYPG
ncbi:MAG TPA: hypothetical protein VGL35_13420 [Rhizomicrobium sp.]